MWRLLRRRRWIVDRFQLRILMAGMLQQLIILGLLALAIVFPMFLELRKPTELTRTREDIACTLLFLHTHIWPAAGALLVLMAIQWTVVTHRIAGPLYRFRQIFRAASAGDLSVPVRIRKTDYLHDEARSIEAMIDGLNTLVSEVQDRSERAADALESLRVTAERGGQVREVLGRLDERLRELQASVQKFKLDA